MSRRIVILLIIVAIFVIAVSVFVLIPELFKSAVGPIISAFTSIPELFNLPEDWVTIELTLFSNLFKSAVNWVTIELPKLFMLVVDYAAIPMLNLLSLFRIAIPKEVAAGLTFSLVALIVILFMRSSFTKIAFRNVPRRKLRNSLTVLAVVLGVALVLGVNIAFDSSFVEFKHTISQAAGNVDINIRSALDEPFDQTLLATVKEVEGVANASGRVSGQVVILGSNGSWEAPTVIGIDSSSDFSYLDPDVKTTRKLPFIKFPIHLEMNGTSAVIDEGLNHTIGDLIPVYVITDFNQTEQSNQTEQIDLNKLFFLKVTGIYHPTQIGEEQYGGQTVFIDLVKAQQIFGRKGKLDYIIVKVADIEQTERVIENLKSKLGEEYIVTPVKEKILTEMGQAVSGFQSGLQIMSALSLSVATIIILNTIYMNIGERTFEIGILRSMGSSKRQIFWMFFSESLTLGLIGVVIGLIIGLPLAQAFTTLSSRMYMPLMPPAKTYVVTPWHFILGTITGLITSILGGLFPSMLACRMDVVKALRPAMRKAGKPRTALMLIAVGLPLSIVGGFIYMWVPSEQIGSDMLAAIYTLSLGVPLLMAGLIFLTAGLLRALSPFIESVLIPFGRTKKIISRNIERNLTRSTICFTLIGITLSFIVVTAGAQAGMIKGMEDVIHSFYSVDLTVNSQTLLPRSFADNLTSIDDCTLVTFTAPALIVPRRVLLVNNASNSEMKSASMVLAIDPATYSGVMSMKFSDETPTNVFERLYTSGTIILTSPLAESLNVTVDSVVAMQTNSEDGTTTWMNFTVVGLAVGTILEWPHGLYSSPLSEACYISYESLDASFPKYRDKANLFFVKVESNRDVGQVRNRVLELYGSEHRLSTLTVEDALEPARAGIDRTFVMLNSVVMFAVVNAAIGVAAIMVMNVIERRREIGIMRSQGMSRFQVVVSIIGEAIVLAAVGFAVGAMSGLILHRFTVSFMSLTGFSIPYIIPFDAIGFSFALAVLASFISAAYPAYWASKLNIVEALRHLI